MHVLLLPSWYPTPDVPESGVFFRDQALALHRAGLRVGVAFVELRSLRRFRPGLLPESHFQVTQTVEEGVLTLRQRGWNPFAQTIPGALVWAAMTRRLVGRYIRLHGRPGVLHAHASLWAGYAAMQVRAHYGIPFVVTEHATQFRHGPFPRPRLRRALRVFEASAARLAVSEPLRDSMARQGVSSEIRIVPNAIDPDFWTLPPRPRPQTPFTFCAVGILVARKAFDVLIRAFASRFRGLPAFRLTIGGDGEMRRELESLAHRLDIQEQVRFLGSLTREDVRQSMWNANCLVLPSLTETFGVVVAEALFTGLPVVATRSGGPEHMVDQDAGVLVDPGDEQGLAEALVAVAGADGYDPGSIRASAVRRFGYAAVAERLCDIYHEVLTPP